MTVAPDRGAAAPWFKLRKANPRAKTRLFCFPYAGGGPLIYRGWEHYLPAGVEVCPVELPGRGSRFKEPPYGSMNSLVGDVAEAMRRLLDLPFSFFGHSLGALVSFELAHKLREELGVTPGRLFVSGCGAPQLPRGGQHIHHLPDEQFIAGLRALNGTPREVLENRELLQTMLATLRADFKLAETYVCPAKPPLSCPVTVFGGSEDASVSREDAEAWGAQTADAFDYWRLPGDHFFLHENEPIILRILARGIQRLLN